jgi:hypothetical protein
MRGRNEREEREGSLSYKKDTNRQETEGKEGGERIGRGGRGRKEGVRKIIWIKFSGLLRWRSRKFKDWF